MYIRDDLIVTVVAELATAKCQHALAIGNWGFGILFRTLFFFVYLPNPLGLDRHIRAVSVHVQGFVNPLRVV